MSSQRSAEETRYIKQLKNFYGEFYSYLAVNGALTLLWFVTGGSFWPIWIILTWGAYLTVKASKLYIIEPTLYKQCDAFRERALTLKKDWEQETLDRLIKNAREKGLFSTHLLQSPLEKNNAKHEKPVTSKKTTVKEATAKDTTVQKSRKPIKKPASQAQNTSKSSNSFKKPVKKPPVKDKSAT
tara:strand:- start:24 stop:575 length:552 start_codon:yes stop_codon:yes gene_type:complete